MSSSLFLGSEKKIFFKKEDIGEILFFKITISLFIIYDDDDDDDIIIITEQRNDY